MIALRVDRIDSLPWLHFEILEVRNDVRRETKSREESEERENVGELQNVEDDWLFSLLLIDASEKSGDVARMSLLLFNSHRTFVARTQSYQKLTLLMR